jgi:ABC-2 type transport system ATP-binding protein
MTIAAIRTAELSRTYQMPRPARARRNTREAAAEFLALDRVSLEVQPGELFGLLGTNGAGKTTLIKILTTLLVPSGGSAQVDGLDVVKDTQAIRERINMVSGGETSGYGVLTVRENLWLFSQLYGVPRKEAERRIDGPAGRRRAHRKGRYAHQPALYRPPPEDELLPRLCHPSTHPLPR